jgi:hypothetical protein
LIDSITVLSISLTSLPLGVPKAQNPKYEENEDSK